MISIKITVEGWKIVNLTILEISNFQIETSEVFPNFPLYIYCNDSFKPLTFTFGNSQLVTEKHDAMLHATRQAFVQ